MELVNPLWRLGSDGEELPDEQLSQHAADAVTRLGLRDTANVKKQPAAVHGTAGGTTATMQKLKAAAAGFVGESETDPAAAAAAAAAEGPRRSKRRKL